MLAAPAAEAYRNPAGDFVRSFFVAILVTSLKPPTPCGQPVHLRRTRRSTNIVVGFGSDLLVVGSPMLRRKGRAGRASTATTFSYVGEAGELTHG